jgi:3-oxoacyl-[acyl-carrier protein] reductase
MADHHEVTLKDQYALVTGGSRGVGFAVAQSLASAGCNIAITSRSLEDCRAASRKIQERAGVDTLAAECDVSHQKGVHELFLEVSRWSGNNLHILVCNAGYRFSAEIWDTRIDETPPESLEAWYLDVFRTDTMGSVFCTFEALPLMMARKSGSIIYISSTPAIEGFRGAPYTVAKAAVLGFMRDVAREYGRFNIRANALALGSIQTPATFSQLDPASRKEFAEEAPLGRWGDPEEVGRAALFLASDLSSFITGQTLIVDGGAVRR